MYGFNYHATTKLLVVLKNKDFQAHRKQFLVGPSTRAKQCRCWST